jgi:hypothetical protein
MASTTIAVAAITEGTTMVGQATTIAGITIGDITAESRDTGGKWKEPGKGCRYVVCVWTLEIGTLEFV